MEDGPFCFGLQKAMSDEESNKFEEAFEATLDALEETVNRQRKQSYDPNPFVAVMLAEEQYTFSLTFKTYDNATRDSDILVDKLIEADFGRQRVIMIEFMTPVFLSQRHE